MAFGAEVANLIVALKLDDSGFSGKLNKAARQLKGMDAGLSQAGRGAGQLAGGLARVGERAAIAAAGGLAAVVTTAASFEQAFTGVEKTVDGTDAQLAELEETIRAMARSMPVSFEELSAIGEAGGALGIARESLDEFIDVVARLSVSTNLSADQAATALGQLGNVLHLEGAELEEFADTLVALGNAGASTEDQIVEMAARFGAAGNSAGLTSDEILALSSAVASMGIEVEAGGSSLSRLFNNVTTGIGTNSKEAQAFANAIGVSMGEFRKSWEDDALGTFQDLLATLNELDQFEAAALLQDIGITNTRDVNTIRLMAQNMGFVGEQLQVAADAQGALDKESQKFFDTTSGQWKTFVNIMRDAAATIGTEVLPVTKDLLSELSENLNNPETREQLKAFGTDLAEGVRGFIDQMKGTDFSGIIGGLKLTAEIAKGAFDAFRALPQPIQQLAIAALVANKVTGGAIGQIAAGLGNLVLGSLKTITAGHVTVVGGTVTGGGGGVPAGGGGVGGSIARGLKVGAALGSIPLAGAAAVEVINFGDMRDKATGNLEEVLNNMDRGTLAETQASIDKIQTEINAERPLLDGILFNTNVKPVLERELSELQQVKQSQYRVADKTQALEGLARSAQNYYSRTASAAERTAAKDFSLNPELNVHTNLTVPVSVSVNASVIAAQLYRARTSVRGTDGIHHSGGFV
jgi:TP901 family phage tail tape measure protein